ncbi:hypothetical protein D3C87_65240 [compost metagenome]
MKNKIRFFLYLNILLIASCQSPQQNKESVQNITPSNQSQQPNFIGCLELDHFPVLYSYASDSLKRDLYSRIVKPLSKKEKKELFQMDSPPFQLDDPDFLVFPVNRINYSNSTLVIYLAKQKTETSFHEADLLILAIYDQAGKPGDFLYNVLEDVYSSTYEVTFTSQTTFDILNTYKEYSPDPESEAEDIKYGRVHEDALTTERYRVDGLKFRKLD